MMGCNVRKIISELSSIPPLVCSSETDLDLGDLELENMTVAILCVIVCIFVDLRKFH